MNLFAIYIISLGAAIVLSFVWLVIKKGVIDSQIKHGCDICHGYFSYGEWIEGRSFGGYSYPSCCRKCFEKTYHLDFDTLEELS